MATRMLVQRLSIRAAVGKLKVISVWGCLAKSGANIFRWSIDVDHKTGVESMTVDIVKSDPLRTAGIAAALGEASMEMTVSAFQLEVVSNPDPAHEPSDSLAIARPVPRLRVVRNIARSHASGEIDDARAPNS